jgi:NAD(P)-dependent dehydrogenase (short-subunit alcohol dehydrogenase family)
MERFEGCVAVVTGAASGIGYALAERLAQEGARLVVADVEKPALEEAASKLSHICTELVSEVTDVSKFEDVERLAISAYERFGEVNLLCNNAGVYTAGRLWECTLDDWRWVLGVNLWGVIHGIKAFLPRMVDSGKAGHVLNTASVAGLVGGPILGIYSTAKFGVVALSEALQFDLRLSGAPIGVSVLCPGFVRTRIVEAARNRPPELSDTHQDEALQAIDRAAAARILEQGMDPGEVAEIALEGIRQGRFYIYTHPWTEALIRMRCQSLMDGKLSEGLLQAMSVAGGSSSAQTQGST